MKTAEEEKQDFFKREVVDSMKQELIKKSEETRNRLKQDKNLVQKIRLIAN
jgi:hypothetical protein